MNFHRTKIIATLGPATDHSDMFTKTLNAGVDLVRLNFSHGTHEDHARRIEMVHQYAQDHQREIGIIADLQGPKIRISKFKAKKNSADKRCFIYS